MAVPMRMWLYDFAFMGVIVVGIMHVPVLVFHFIMHMLVFVPFCQMKPESNRHQSARDYELRCHWFLQQQNGKNCTDKWCQREIGPCSCCTEMAQAKHEHHKAHANPEKPYKRSGADDFI
jgi:hypothetical protein